MNGENGSIFVSFQMYSLMINFRSKPNIHHFAGLPLDPLSTDEDEYDNNEDSTTQRHHHPYHSSCCCRCCSLPPVSSSTTMSFRSMQHLFAYSPRLLVSPYILGSLRCVGGNANTLYSCKSTTRNYCYFNGYFAPLSFASDSLSCWHPSAPSQKAGLIADFRDCSRCEIPNCKY